MRYLRAYRFVFDSPKWVLNLLCGLVCLFIPVLGRMVFAGYAYEMVEELHRRGDANYPPFDFNRFVKYLVRGVWPFVIGLVFGLPLAFIIYLLWFIIILTAGGAGEEKAGAFLAVLLPTFIIFILVAVFLVGLVVVPLSLRAGLSQELAFAPSIEFLRDFWKRVWKELLLAQLFLYGSSLVVTLVGLLFCCIGIYPAAVCVLFAQYHLQYQLYVLYLQRGGTAIPLKLEAVED